MAFWLTGIPHYTSLSNKTISAQGDDNRVSRSRSPEISTDNGTARYDGLAAKYDVLRPGDCCTSRNLVACILSLL
jgi:hypothetical protein